MKVNEIGAPAGAKRTHKRRGRGSGSGHGKTSGRGHKGARARTGTATRPGFEGGQMPLIRRLPKRGFSSFHAVAFQVVNVESLNAFEKGSRVGLRELKEAGFVSSRKRPVKILGDGSLTKALTVQAHAFSKSAKKKLEEAGGKYEYVAVKEAKKREAAEMPLTPTSSAKKGAPPKAA